MKSREFGPRVRSVRLLAAAIATGACFVAPAHSSAQVSRIGNSVATLHPGGIWRGVDTAYDPANDAYLVVTGYGAVYGRFVNGSNQPISETFAIFDGGSGFGNLPKAEYSPHVSNGNGGQGGFLVVWVTGGSNTVQGRIVALDAPGRLVSRVEVISDATEGRPFMENRPVIAYSRSSQRFLVAWTTISPTFGLQGRLIDTNGSPSGRVIRFEESGSRDPAVAWNAATDDFGLVNGNFSDAGSFTTFRRIRAADGTVSSRTAFSFSVRSFATGIDVNSATNQYVLTWAQHPGTMSATFDSSGTLVGTRFVTGRLGFDLSLGLAFNATSGTFLVVGSDAETWEIGGVELSGDGVPKATSQIISDGGTNMGSFYPLAEHRTATNQWNMVYSRGYRGATNQILASAATATSSPAPSAPPPPPPPAPVPTACTTADPFRALGGGTCCGRGWLPPGLTCSSAPAPPAPAPAPPAPPTPPPPAPVPTACTTADPFRALGGGTCCGRGWLPPGLTCSSAPVTPAPAPAPPPATSGCTTPNPFTSIPRLRGECRNGGWVPVIAGG
jgi:hypothetical protein